MKQLSKFLWKVTKIVNKSSAYLRDMTCHDKLPYYCPCCQRHLKEFVQGGFDKYPEVYSRVRYTIEDNKVLCPICHSLPRYRILVEWLEENADAIKSKQKILYFAPEKQVLTWFSRNQVNYTTADLFRKADLNINIENTDLANEQYDMIICNHVLEHVTDYRKALNELHRIVKQDGIIIISFPTDMQYETVYENPEIDTDEGRIEQFGQIDHLRIFGRDTVDLLEGFGFDVKEILGEKYSRSIKPVIGPADYDYNVFWLLSRK